MRPCLWPLVITNQCIARIGRASIATTALLRRSESTMEAVEPNYVRAEARAFAVLQRFGIDAPNFEIRDVARGLDIDVKMGGVSGGDARIVKLENGRGI